MSTFTKEGERENLGCGDDKSTDPIPGTLKTTGRLKSNA